MAAISTREAVLLWVWIVATLFVGPFGVAALAVWAAGPWGAVVAVLIWVTVACAGLAKWCGDKTGEW